MVLFTVIILLTEWIYLLIKCREYRGKLKFLREQQSAGEAFVATVVHDLKTPASSQITTLKMLKNGSLGELNEAQLEMISILLDSCNYMSCLIGTILCTYSDFGKIKLHKSEFNVVRLISEVCRETKSLLKEKGQSVALNNSSENIILYADKLQIRRVILNLLSNAVMYGFGGTEIKITTIARDNEFELYVENFSRQIPSDELAKVFDKYSKTKYSYFNRLSSGLGLYLVKCIVELHNGRVYAKSDANGKCTFGFVIPNNGCKIKRCKPFEKPASLCNL